MLLPGLSTEGSGLFDESGSLSAVRREGADLRAQGPDLLLSCPGVTAELLDLLSQRIAFTLGQALCLGGASGYQEDAATEQKSDESERERESVRWSFHPSISFWQFRNLVLPARGFTELDAEDIQPVTNP